MQVTNKDCCLIAEEVLVICRKNGIKIATAESCTGGLIASYITNISGSSDVLERGYITYSNESKNEVLGVPKELILKYGAVSKQVAIKMAEGALENSLADLTISVTGIAGPGGGSEEKPVGLVYMAAAKTNSKIIHEKNIFLGDRNEIRLKAVKSALSLALKSIAN